MKIIIFLALFAGKNMHIIFINNNLYVALAQSLFAKRLAKELKEMQTNPPPGLQVEHFDHDLKLYVGWTTFFLTNNLFYIYIVPCDLSRWKIKVVGAAGTLYEGEQFVLQVLYSDIIIENFEHLFVPFTRFCLTLVFLAANMIVSVQQQISAGAARGEIFDCFPSIAIFLLNILYLPWIYLYF